MKYINVNCPHCGKELPIPDDTETIICMYCAQPIDVHALQNDHGEKLLDYHELLTQAENDLPNDLFTQPIRIEDISAKAYPDMFQKKCAELQPALDEFNCACRAAADSNEVITSFAETILKRLQKAIADNDIKKPSDPRFYNYTYMIVTLLIPSILEFHSEFSDPLADAFLAKWKTEYPKNPIGKATYEKINSGFKRKFCFITTAACQTLHKPDNCYELNAFRNFRDNWLTRTSGGAVKIQEYYLFAPMIVEAIDRSPRKEEVYHRIWRDYLSPCLADIEQNKQQACAELYEKMVKDLELEWL